ncbi:MAG TPA: hypothetical protein VG733_12950 [Chthoniobacteraceae bacterium]|nr:hypothetical protein [Chthoniobacteraceae bacterium]
MARRFFRVALGAALFSFFNHGPLCQAQTPAIASASPAPSASPSASGEDDSHTGPGKRRPFSRDFLTPEQQKYYDSLAPDEQQSVRENWRRWVKMTREERDQFRLSEKVRHERMQAEINDAIKQTGLQLDDKTRELFAKRYTEERRKIEQKLQMEMEEKRRPLVQALIERLKTEFETAASSAAPAASPQASGTTSGPASN